MVQRLKRYYTLCLRDDGDMRWRPEFGDYDYNIVRAELQSYMEHAYLKKNAQIITSGDTQAEIDAAVRELNDAAG
jgi:hypothetical protein